MRPLIDVNNLSYSKEKLIYYSQTTLVSWILVAIGLLIYAIYSLIIDRSFMAPVLLLPLILFIGYHSFKLFKKIDEVQFRINSEGIQYRNEALISWSNIKSERVETKGSGKHSRDFFIYYIVDQDKVINYNISNLNTDKHELQQTIKIHKNRYIRENNL